MTAMAADRRVTRLGGELYKRTVPVAAGAKIYSGAKVMLNAGGFGTPAAAGNAAFVVAGLAESYQDNTSGADGDLEVVVESDVTIDLANDGTNPVTQADVGQVVFSADDQTVSRVATGARPATGILHEIRNGVPFVFIPKPGRKLV